MKVKIRDSCTGCEFCADACADVFVMNNGKAVVIVDEVPPILEDIIKEIIVECPVKAITKA